MLEMILEKEKVGKNNKNWPKRKCEEKLYASWLETFLFRMYLHFSMKKAIGKQKDKLYNWCVMCKKSYKIIV